MRVNRRKDGKTKETVAGGRPGGKSYLVPFVLIHEFVLALGIRPRTLGCAEQAFSKGVFTMTKAESGLVQFSTYIAYFLMALPAGAFMKRYGYRKGLSWVCYCSLSVLSGLSGGFCIRLRLSDRLVCDRLRALYLGDGGESLFYDIGAVRFRWQRLNLSQSFNGLGWILGPLVGGLLIFGASEGDSMALTKPYILVGGIVLFVALLFFSRSCRRLSRKKRRR